MSCISAAAPIAGGGPQTSPATPPILQNPLTLVGGANGGVTGGGGGAGTPELAAALEQLWSALGSLKAALEGAAGVSGGGGASGCGCGQAQAVAGAGALGAPMAGADSPPDAPAPAPAPAAAVKPDAAPAGYKIKHPLPGAKLTSSFGEVSSIRNNRPHGGTDLAKPTGTPVLAAAPGRVVSVDFGVKGDTGGSGGGNMVTIDHGNGWFTRYAHLSGTAGPSVKKGDIVEAGQVLAKVGSTGNSTGPHLHFEIFKGGLEQGKRVNAEPYLDGSKTF